MSTETKVLYLLLLKNNAWCYGVVTLQVALGITTLIYLVPIPLAALHQAGALALLTASLAFSAKLKKPRPQFVQFINSNMKSKLLKREFDIAKSL